MPPCPLRLGLSDTHCIPYCTRIPSCERKRVLEIRCLSCGDPFCNATQLSCRDAVFARIRHIHYCQVHVEFVSCVIHKMGLQCGHQRLLFVESVPYHHGGVLYTLLYHTGSARLTVCVLSCRCVCSSHHKQVSMCTASL